MEVGKKVLPILLTKEKIFEADRFVEDLKTAYEKVKYALQCSQIKQKKAADQRRRELLFLKGEWCCCIFIKLDCIQRKARFDCIQSSICNIMDLSRSLR